MTANIMSKPRGWAKRERMTSDGLREALTAFVERERAKPYVMIQRSPRTTKLSAKAINGVTIMLIYLSVLMEGLLELAYEGLTDMKEVDREACKLCSSLLYAAQLDPLHPTIAYASQAAMKRCGVASPPWKLVLYSWLLLPNLGGNGSTPKFASRTVQIHHLILQTRLQFYKVMPIGLPACGGQGSMSFSGWKGSVAGIYSAMEEGKINPTKS